MVPLFALKTCSGLSLTVPFCYLLLVSCLSRTFSLPQILGGVGLCALPAFAFHLLFHPSLQCGFHPRHCYAERTQFTWSPDCHTDGLCGSHPSGPQQFEPFMALGRFCLQPSHLNEIGLKFNSFEGFYILFRSVFCIFAFQFIRSLICCCCYFKQLENILGHI